MALQRDTVTDRLINVIQVLQLGRKSGTLSVERGEGISFEEGFIIFSNGQVVQANVGSRQGLDAFNWLNSWGACRFAFIPSSNTGPVSPFSTTGNLPAYRSRDTSPRLSAHLPAVSGGKQTQNTYMEYRPGNGRREESYPTQIASPLPIPYRTRQLDEGLRLIEQMNLSRTHKRLFLLVDGHRNIAELVRLMGRNQEEVQRLLLELERIGLIRQ